MLFQGLQRLSIFADWGLWGLRFFEGGGSLLPLPRYSLRFVIWSRLRRPTFQRWKVGKDRRACGPGPGVGGRRWRYGACKSFGCYPPFWPPPSILRPLAPRADIPLAKLVSSCPAFGCTHAAQRWYQPLQDGLGVEAAGVFFLVFSAFCAFRVFRASRASRASRAFSFA